MSILVVEGSEWVSAWMGAHCTWWNMHYRCPLENRGFAAGAGGWRRPLLSNHSGNCALYIIQQKVAWAFTLLMILLCLLQQVITLHWLRKWVQVCNEKVHCCGTDAHITVGTHERLLMSPFADIRSRTIHWKQVACLLSIVHMNWQICVTCKCDFVVSIARTKQILIKYFVQHNTLNLQWR